MEHRRWTEDEDNLIREHYLEMGIACWRLIPDRMPHQVQRRASTLGVKSKRKRNKRLIPTKEGTRK